jgi:hypothetical protein
VIWRAFKQFYRSVACKTVEAVTFSVEWCATVRHNISLCSLVTTFWDIRVPPGSPVKFNRSFGGIYRVYFKGRRVRQASNQREASFTWSRLIGFLLLLRCRSEQHVIVGRRGTINTLYCGTMDDNLWRWGENAVFIRQLLRRACWAYSLVTNIQAPCIQRSLFEHLTQLESICYESDSGSVSQDMARLLWKQKVFCLPTLQPWPPLWSSGQSSWLQIRRPGFDSRH